MSGLARAKPRSSQPHSDELTAASVRVCERDDSRRLARGGPLDAFARQRTDIAASQPRGTTFGTINRVGVGKKRTSLVNRAQDRRGAWRLDSGAVVGLA